MPDITFTLSAGAATRVANAMKDLYPIPVDENGDATFSDNAWPKEVIRQWVKEQVRRWEESVAADTARRTIADIPDNEIT
jgi:hypothetical protein